MPIWLDDEEEELWEYSPACSDDRCDECDGGPCDCECHDE